MDTNSRILLELNNLKNIASRMQNVVNSCSNIERTIDNIAANIDSIWEGNAKDIFSEQCTELLNRSKLFSEDIKEHKAQLEEAVVVYKKTELKVTTSVNDLSTKNIF
ncbi:MAG: hypothetical protein RSD97_08175 [Lachnospiraceae bacterium]